MKIVSFFTSLIFLISCSGDKSVYWCGDHACINKKERESYFKKTMIVEKKIVNKKNEKDLTKSEEIIKKAKINEKNRITNEKRLKMEQKEQARNAKLEKKRLKREEKELAKKIKNKKKLSKEKKNKITKHEKTVSFSTSSENAEFEQIKDQIIKKNLIRSYPDINDIPN